MERSRKPKSTGFGGVPTLEQYDSNSLGGMQVLAKETLLWVLCATSKQQHPHLEISRPNPEKVTDLFIIFVLTFNMLNYSTILLVYLSALLITFDNDSYVRSDWCP